MGRFEVLSQGGSRSHITQTKMANVNLNVFGDSQMILDGCALDGCHIEVGRNMTNTQLMQDSANPLLQFGSYTPHVTEPRLVLTVGTTIAGGGVLVGYSEGEEKGKGKGKGITCSGTAVLEHCAISRCCVEAMGEATVEIRSTNVSFQASHSLKLSHHARCVTQEEDVKSAS